MSGPLQLYGYQRAWLADSSRFKAGMMARQTGKTFTTTLEVVDDCFAHVARQSAARWVILSRGERQAREAMEEGVKRHARAYSYAADIVETGWEAGAVSYKALEVSLPHGGRITALPANPDTARGFSANVLADEFAFHQDSRAIWKALFPVISAGHRIRVISTPNGKENKFYEIMTETGGVWSKRVTDIYQAVADGLPRDIEALKAGLGDADAWAQEYELKWLDEASAWLSYDLISACEHDEAGEPGAWTGQPVFIGNDIAARRDLWVAVVLEPVGDVLWCREIVTLKGASFAEQDAAMDALFARYRVARLVMDQTGMGEKPVEDAIGRYGAARVEGVLFTPGAKLVLASHGKQAFEDRGVRIPMGDLKLRADLHKLKKITSATGAPRFVAESGPDGHADRAWALFMGVYGAAHRRAPIDFRSLGARVAAPGLHIAPARGFGCVTDAARQHMG